MNNSTFNGGGYENPRYDFPTKVYCQTLQLADNPDLIERYRKVHAEIWKEIPEGIRAVGILEMKLFLAGTTAVMLVVTPIDFDWDTQMAKLAKLPRQQEWEDHVALVQQFAAGHTSDEKWQMMEQFFCLPSQKDQNN
jgi:L-rhamnose mutarotase